MKTIAFVIANHGFQDHEFGVPYEVLSQEDTHIQIYSGKGWRCEGSFGRVIENTFPLSTLFPAEMDLVIFVGGNGAYHQYHQDPEYTRVAYESSAIAAICIAPTILAETGIFQGKKITGRDDGESTQIQIMTAHGALFQNVPVCQDGAIITANGPQSAELFAEKIYQFLFPEE